MWSTLYLDRIVIHGQFRINENEFLVAITHAPYDNEVKHVSWDILSVWVNNHIGQKLCICGDFNVVQMVEEGENVGVVPRISEHAPFNNFIDDNLLVDLPLYGRRFIRFKAMCSP